MRKFLGGTWVVASHADLEVAASLPNVTSIEEVKGPGGGKRVSIVDPNGNLVYFIHGQESKTPAAETEITRETEDTAPLNFSYRKTRQGRFRRFDLGPSPVHKLGHYGYMVPIAKYKETLDFYTTVMNLKPTDSVYNPQTGEDTTCFMHIDLGKEYSDHHVRNLKEIWLVLTSTCSYAFRAFSWAARQGQLLMSITPASRSTVPTRNHSDMTFFRAKTGLIVGVLVVMFWEVRSSTTGKAPTEVSRVYLTRTSNNVTGSTPLATFSNTILMATSSTVIRPGSEVPRHRIPCISGGQTYRWLLSLAKLVMQGRLCLCLPLLASVCRLVAA
jgi:hypothetical protein